MYNLDPNSARKADQTGQFLNEIGKFVGKFTQAEDLKASSGTRGIGFRFESNGQRANLSLYTEKADGTRLMGFDAVMAIMTCMGLRNIEPKPGRVKAWDAESKQEIERNAQIFPELCNKPIGLLLETEDYAKQDGSIGTRMVIAGIFQAGTELVASEILDRKTTPEKLAGMVARLRHRPIKTRTPAKQGAATGSTGSGFDDMDDDSIPF